MQIKKTVKLFFSLTLLFVFFIDILFLLAKKFNFFTSSINFFGKIGFYLWITLFFYLLLFSFIALIRIIKISFKKKNFFTVFVLLFLLIFVLFQATNEKNLSGETTQEISCAINHIYNSPDAGFWKTCFLGYPTRQYYFMSLPTIFFGRYLFILNLGTYLYFFLSFIFFVYGLITYLGFNDFNDKLIAIFLTLPFHFYYFNHFIFLYEQSVFPFLFLLLLIGVTLIYLKNKGFYFVLIIFTLYALAYSYTPSLAIIGLFYFLLLVYLIKTKQINKENLLLFFLFFAFFPSFLLRTDINLIKTEERSIPQLISDLKMAFNHLIFQNQGNPFVSAFLNPFLLLIILLSLAGFFGIYGIIIGVWSILVLSLAILSRGYSYYGIDFRLHRAMIILPLLFLNALIKASKFNAIKKLLNKVNIFLLTLIFFFFSTGIYFSATIIKERQVSNHYLLIKELGKKRLFFQENKKILFFDPSLKIEFISLNDELQYFFPNLRSEIVNDACEINNLASNTIFIIKEKDNYCNWDDEKWKIIEKINFGEQKLLLLQNIL